MHKLKCIKFHLNRSKHFFTVKLIKYQSMLLGEVVRSLFIVKFKTQEDIALGNHDPSLSRK